MDVRRRILLTMLCLSLASLAPAPLSACALLMSLPADCAPDTAKSAAPATHCEQVMASEGQAEKNKTSLHAGPLGLNCCQVASAPVPDASAGSGKTNVAPLAAALTNAPQASVVQIFDRSAAPAEQAQFSSPPDLQSLLCTFLI